MKIMESLDFLGKWKFSWISMKIMEFHENQWFSWKSIVFTKIHGNHGVRGILRNPMEINVPVIFRKCYISGIFEKSMEIMEFHGTP